jgi:Zn-dependent protease
MIKTLLALLAAGKLGKFLLSGASMLVAVVAYAFVYGWRYAAGFVALLLVHEAGHYIAAKKRGLDVGLPTFIPFVGAWINLKEQPMDAETEAFVGIAGPMLGSAAAFVCYMAARSTGSELLLALAYAGFLLNLFNLIPLSPLDGGRIVSVISPRIWFLGVPILVGLFLWTPSPMLILIAALAAPQLWTAFKDRSVLDSVYYRAAPSVRLEYTIHYLLLLGFLAVLAYDTHEALGGGRFLGSLGLGD